MSTRTEKDFLGPLDIPADRYYGIETQRACRNFQITGVPIAAMPELIVALAWIKKAAVRTNRRAGDIDVARAAAIEQACDELLAGKHHDEFVVDVIQGGAGTSSNMNANEVIANRALEILNRPRGAYTVIHPKDDVNRCQSTNDVYATAIRLTVVQLNHRLIAAVQKCLRAFQERAGKFDGVQKLGRTQLQDALPMTVGQELRAFAISLAEDVARLEETQPLLLEVNLGGTAIGTAVGVSDYYLGHIVPELARVSGLAVTPAGDRIEATWDTGIFVFYSGLLKRLATKLCKIANDLRLLSSGPFGGIGELRLPEKQPGSSMMPGKVNPVIPEVVNQTCYRVFGADTTVTFAAESGQLQLNAMEPVILWSIYEATSSLIAAVETLVDNCIVGLEVNTERCGALLAASPARATTLARELGYGVAAEVALAMVRDGLSFEAAVQRVLPDTANAVLASLASSGP
ncbi:MAG: aspartate ammonia-lyase [Pseudomonadota bacterium]